MSRRLLPKQFLPLVSERTLFQETLLRLDGLANVAPGTILCSEDHRFLAAEQLREIGAPAGELILEPAARNTAPAIAAAAMSVLDHDKDGILLVLPSDLLIRDPAGFVRATERAITSATSPT